MNAVKHHSRKFLHLPSRMLRAADRVAGNLGVFNKPLLPNDLINRARRCSQLDDFGDWPFEEPLAVLLKAYEEEANLSVFGRIAARWDMIRFLSNLLRLRAEEKNDSSIVSEQILAPVFILGLPRSGTTFLHNLMAHDPANAVARCWQTIYPYPEPRRWYTSADPRAKNVARQFSSFLKLAPDLPSLHPLEADAAQECIEITGQVIRSLRFDTTHYVPSYERWLDEEGHFEAYRFHKRFLQHLQHQNGGGHWVLKSPDHVYALDALLEVYPDARLIFVHRDPMRVLASVARLTEILRAPFTRSIDRLQIGRQVSNRWVDGSRRLIDASERFRSCPERIFHVRYNDLVRDPFSTVSRLYRHFRMNLSHRAEMAFKLSIAQRPTGGYGQNSYRSEDYGMDPATERRRYTAYVEYFRIDPEVAANKVTADPRIRMAV